MNVHYKYWIRSVLTHDIYCYVPVLTLDYHYEYWNSYNMGPMEQVSILTHYWYGESLIEMRLLLSIWHRHWSLHIKTGKIFYARSQYGDHTTHYQDGMVQYWYWIWYTMGSNMYATGGTSLRTSNSADLVMMKALLDKHKTYPWFLLISKIMITITPKKGRVMNVKPRRKPTFAFSWFQKNVFEILTEWVKWESCWLQKQNTPMELNSLITSATTLKKIQTFRSMAMRDVYITWEGELSQ